MLKFFAEKMWVATHIFSTKNIWILYIESAKTVNKMTLNELVKLTTLWTTGPWISILILHIILFIQFSVVFYLSWNIFHIIVSLSLLNGKFATARRWNLHAMPRQYTCNFIITSINKEPFWLTFTSKSLYLRFVPALTWTFDIVFLALCLPWHERLTLFFI